ncbi:MAG: hypothetical protein KJ851_05245 [Nanoarchaeota archaeon]|nr:hypothetical protein [Nanoarchaeota archaeon]
MNIYKDFHAKRANLKKYIVLAPNYIMGFFGKILDKWSKNERDDKEKARLEAIKHKKLAAEAEKKREEIMITKNAKKLQLEDWKKAATNEETLAKEKKRKEELDKLDWKYKR